MSLGSVSRKTPESFRQACRRFVYTENLLTGAPNSQDAASTSMPLRSLSEATPILKKVITQMETEDGWVLLGELGRQLANLASDFDPRTFGFRKLSDLVRRTNSFRDRSSKGRLHAHSHKVPRPITSEIEDRYQNCDMRKSRPRGLREGETLQSPAPFRDECRRD